MASLIVALEECVTFADVARLRLGTFLITSRDYCMPVASLLNLRCLNLVGRSLPGMKEATNFRVGYMT
jgi:hypothetical protein